MKKLSFLVLIGVFGLGCTIAAIKLVSAQTQSQTNNSLTKLTKTVTLDSGWDAGLNIGLGGLASGDVVNIVPGGTGRIVSKVVTIADMPVGVPDSNTSLTAPLPGADVPENSLQVSSTDVSFQRPAIQGRILLYIEVPEGTKVSVTADASRVVNAYPVSAPLNVKGGVLGKGQSTLGKAIVMLMDPENGDPSDGIKGLGGNKYFVPYEKLSVTNGQNSLVGLSFIANIDIDESGTVTTVRVLQPLNSPQVSNALNGLRFEPFILNGATVKVSTVVKQ
ncbi:MAG: hypothetical protein DYH05_10535 [Acidobacteria bacterium ACB1]|nr:hypothetical protein [Pyrinomonadaceae bacterium]MCE7962918.1 hypothetical protein [Acidobacteria bacterium ACB1]